MKIGTIKGRHEMPVTEYFFDKEITDVFDFDFLTQHIHKRIEELNIKEVELYVTGLTIVTVSVMNVCRAMDIPITLFHYDRETAQYREQIVI